MDVVTITSGAHWRNVGVSQVDTERQFAHIFDPESPEDVPHEAHNFITYANALGEYEDPIVLYRPDEDIPEWVAPIEAHSARHFGPEDEHIEVMMADWVQIVTTATGRKVEIR